MAGGTSVQARRAFSQTLMEDLESSDSEQLKPLRKLNDGVAGYVFDLVPLRATRVVPMKDTSEVLSDQAHGALNSIMPSPDDHSHADDTARLTTLLQASLDCLSPNTLRIVNSARSPHEILRLIRDVGIDVFDAHWAQRAADIGIVLDFRFPVPENPSVASTNCPGPRTRHNGKLDLGHNLYDAQYAHDHSRLASSFLDAFSHQGGFVNNEISGVRVCPCAACSPARPADHLRHSSVDRLSFPIEPENSKTNLVQPPLKRSYLHHLLHTHEMSAHSLLVMHNLSVLDAFFDGVRKVIADVHRDYEQEVERFLNMYDEDMTVCDEAKLLWAQVERARGKGRLTREKIKQAESSLGTSVEL
ncbi:uncharacterized protein FIBRA_05019 [Fibroporia radiculosa]|uniref:tRNA-guanine(15) transglycosylase-like domain-containing protein n=1 Tax=Fibroporia radiculosa TaxID=599839 RepID=J4GQ94_9APHY|nr:uncharacterized protein FIBRA_05019 [Fibroporia radiculosa]CCM02905.1 predicted protein [Fibroporia radiculosa]